VPGGLEKRPGAFAELEVLVVVVEEGRGDAEVLEAACGVVGVNRVASETERATLLAVVGRIVQAGRAIDEEPGDGVIASESRLARNNKRQ
jgi:ABC-type nitrate/sulfonate/bicarbonate transport system substrate-binding protein